MKCIPNFNEKTSLNVATWKADKQIEW